MDFFGVLFFFFFEVETESQELSSARRNCTVEKLWEYSNKLKFVI